MIQPGPRNLITDVAGIAVGNAIDETAQSGVTVVLPAQRATAAVDVRGGAPGTRETDLMDPTCLVDQVDAIVLAGGSVFGLAAADGVVEWLRRRGRGFAFGAFAVPIVPAAVIADLLGPGDKNWTDAPPYRDLAQAACDAAGASFGLGNEGAGRGARAGALKGGLGSVSARDDDGLTVGALAVANPVGSPVMPNGGTLWAWPFELAGELGHQRPPSEPIAGADGIDSFAETRLAGHTSLAVVAVDAGLSKAQAQRIAIMAHDGLARAIRPVHTPYDGDTIFVLATGERALGDAEPSALTRIGAMAADCVARAMARAVFEAADLDGIPGYRTRYAGAFAGA